MKIFIFLWMLKYIRPCRKERLSFKYRVGFFLERSNHIHLAVSVKWKKKLRGLLLNWKLLIKCYSAGPVWTGSLGPGGCRTSMKMEPLMLKENRQKPGMVLPFSAHLSVHCHHSFSFFGSRTVDFAASDLYSSSKQITAASRENSYCISTAAALPVQSDVDRSQWPQAHTHSPRPTVEISVFFNPLTQPYWDLLDLFPPSLQAIIYKLMLSNGSL